MKQRKIQKGICVIASLALIEATLGASLLQAETVTEAFSEQSVAAEGVEETLTPQESSVEEVNGFTEESVLIQEEEFTQEEYIEECLEAEETVEEAPLVEEIYLGDYDEVYELEDAKSIISNGHYTSMAQQIADALYEMVSNVQTSCVLPNNGASMGEMKTYLIEAIAECKNINRIFWGNKTTIATYPTSMKYKFTFESDVVSEMWYNYNTHQLEVTYKDVAIIQEATSKFEAEVNQILTLCAKTQTNLEKELIIHDYLVQNGAYDSERLANGTMPNASYSAYGLLVNKTSVCQGYAYGMKYLLRKLGIPCDVVTGGGHAWNIVNIDGENYYVDATWDDPVPDVAGRIRREHFNVTTTQLRASGHTWEESQYPECTSTKYAFLQKSEEYMVVKGKWYYNSAMGGYFNEESYYPKHSLFQYDPETQIEKLLVEGACTNISYDMEKDYVYYTKLGEMSYYDLYQEAKEKVYGFVNGFYEAFLEREGEAKGIEAWSHQLVHGILSGAELAQNFCNSPEFINRNLSDEQYIITLYKGIMGRTAEKKGVAYWKSKLDQGLSRQYILKQFIAADEFTSLCERYEIEKGSITLKNIADQYPNITAFVSRFYRLGLERKPDQGGLNYWVEGLQKGTYSGKQLAQSFLYTKEFISKNEEDEAFIESLYKVFFDRVSDPEGKQFWLERLKGKQERQQVMDEFICSNEYKKICTQYSIS